MYIKKIKNINNILSYLNLITIINLTKLDLIVLPDSTNLYLVACKTQEGIGSISLLDSSYMGLAPLIITK
jgi:hypothetical protein